ncbi:glycoside hydrolase family 127 protein [Mariniflexile sp. AS56]|uniref:glycoside hydrolase family 127 protein n=1 Tax=Mariniflexile sp. AS56 TaxID=3063957 RepID=UPI0026EBCBC3|nr:beta-L-arabinofuranosidase domain-containing protein [Mariniflexile sp. AS56]MDO7173114.1 glycoside hydrolase family 127 protein [Mariniflexile sp. AS56]
MSTSSNKHSNAITNNFESPFVKLKSINFGDCKWNSGFWAEKVKIAEDKMLPYMGDLLCGDIGHGLNNFKIAAGEKKGVHKGFYWHDGDFYKFMEAKMYVYGLTKNESILKELDEYIGVIGRAQEEDGYIHTHVQITEGVDRFENRKYHEMYNFGHLFIAGSVHYRITSQRNFLDIAVKMADLLCAYFMPDTKHYQRFGFNQTQIMGLVELYRTTRDKKYLKLAEKFINRRGTYEIKHDSTTLGYPIGDMVQERTPFRESKEAVGHAVLALYYYAGAADVYAETGEKALLDALDALWENVTGKKMYVTGAVGQAHYGASTNLDMIEEGFIDAYMMPNMTAYNETCANLCNAMFSSRMMAIKDESRYADIIELVLYNSGLSGISVEGKDYFYSNPLRMVNNSRNYDSHADVTESPVRQPYLECFCCPPNLVRTICKSSGWAYNLSENGVAVVLFGGNNLDTTMLDGSPLKLSQDTEYPWKGLVKITVDECKNSAFEIKVRIPKWAVGSTLKVNGEDAGVTVNPGNFATIKRVWKANDVIILDMPMEVTLVEGHNRIEEVRNQVAVKRGPIVYCIETPDLPKEASILDIYYNTNSPLNAVHKNDFLGGVTVVETELLLRTGKNDDMYQTVTKPSFTSFKTQLVPYFVWSNRGQAEMTVFMPIIWN